mmetsp:Transcript_21555/g.68116  ORF Transcript_21555/g.68116 Transcript_21555/m.68116 type:complete len:368 (+) Transcript_21555:111-1214(+)
MPFEGRPVRWGIVGCGNICRDFVSASSALCPEESLVVACAAPCPELAAAFADCFKGANGCGAMRSYGDCSMLLQDAEVDVVYIGSPSDSHEGLCLAALNAGKHVLVEKPMALTLTGARRIHTKAREKGLLLAEGMWTRCFPALRKARELLASGAIGKVKTVAADFGWPATDDPRGPHSRLLHPASGGVSMDIAMYPLGHVLLASGGAPPSKVVATGSTTGDGDARVDWSVSAALAGFAAPAEPGLTASVLVTLQTSTPEEAVFNGTQGTLRIHGAAHTPTRLTLTVRTSRTESREETFDFPLPEAPPGAVLPWNYPGSVGFVYEAGAVVEALRQGLTESTHWTHAEAEATLELVDALRRQTLAADEN